MIGDFEPWLSRHRLVGVALLTTGLEVGCWALPRLVAGPTLTSQDDVRVPVGAIVCWLISVPWILSAPARLLPERLAGRALAGVRVAHVAASLALPVLVFALLALGGGQAPPGLLQRDVALYVAGGTVLAGMGLDGYLAVMVTFAYLGLCLLVGYDAMGAPRGWALPLQFEPGPIGRAALGLLVSMALLGQLDRPCRPRAFVGCRPGPDGNQP